MTITEAKQSRTRSNVLGVGGLTTETRDPFADDLGYDPRNPFEVVLSNGDRATAASPEAILVAARTLASDAREGNYYERYTATFLYEGTCVRADVRSESL